MSSRASSPSHLVLAILLAAGLGGCSLNAATNERLPDHGDAPSQASFAVTPRGAPDVMVLLALSGGGSRAAYLSGAVMLELQQVFDDLDLLAEVDAISSVSGGSLAAAYYCLSRDEDQPDDGVGRRVWEDESVRDLMSRNYLLRWIGNWFWPTNVLCHWFTAFDRTDIMAQTLADNLFDHPFTGRDFRMDELNPHRPHLIVNATDATENTPARRDPSGALVAPMEPHYGNVLTFTREDFTEVLHADIGSYSVARAVMGSAAFPSVFPYMTLRDHRVEKDERRYVHVFDGGNADNLGLKSVERLMRLVEETWPPEERPRQYVVISVDAYTKPRGVDRHETDPRGAVDYVVDRNFLSAIDVLMAHNRWDLLRRFTSDTADLAALREREAQDTPKQWMPSRGGDEPRFVLRPDPTTQETAVDEAARDWQPKDLGGRLFFWHLEFADVSDVRLRARLNDIPTNFLLPSGADTDLDAAAAMLVHEDAAVLRRLRDIFELPVMPELLP